MIVLLVALAPPGLMNALLIIVDSDRTNVAEGAGVSSKRLIGTIFWNDFVNIFGGGNPEMFRRRGCIIHLIHAVREWCPHQREIEEIIAD